MKQWKKFASIFAVLAIMLLQLPMVQAEEGETPQLGEGELLQEILDRGELIVGTSPDFAPMEFIDTTKEGQEQYVGCDMDMARYIADKLGVKLTIKAMDFDAVLASLTTRQIDMAITGITKTPARESSMEMTDSYFDEEGESSWQGVLIKEDMKDVYTSLDTLKGKTIAVQSGSLQDVYVKDQLPDTKVQYITQLNDAIELLNNGTVDAVATAYGNGQEFVKQKDGLYIGTELLFTLNANYTGNRIGIPKGETALLYRTNDIIKEIKENHLYEEWYQSALDYGKTKIEGSYVERVIQIAQIYWPKFLTGLGYTLGISLITVLGGSLLGMILALGKLAKNRFLQFLANAYIEIIRGTPLLLQLWMFVTIFANFNASMSVSVVIALIANSAAYVAEIIRGGITSVDKGQWEAAKSLGMSDHHMMRKIIFPQAFKTILPSLGNEFIMMVKETSLASTFYIGELMSVNNIVKTATYFSLETLTITGIIYLVVTFSLSKLVNFMERRMRVSD